MRIILIAAGLVLCASVPAAAQTIDFSPTTFQIYGGLGNSETGGRQRAPNYKGSQVVSFLTDMPPGSVIVRTHERKLYYVMPGGKAIQYGVGVGRDGFTWSGVDSVSRKAEWPNWHPPQVMIEREAARGHYIPEFMAGGPDNPLGARALYIGNTEYRIHGTSQPWSIGLAVSSGCIRMLNEEVIDLYERVEVGAAVRVE
ncbi:hypothetical protein BH10PSE7_BH10PSE7_00510 [soil metagenome]